MKAVRVHEFGGPEVLTHEDVPDPTPGPGEVVVDMTHADVMFIDTLLRGGWGQDLPQGPALRARWRGRRPRPVGR